MCKVANWKTLIISFIIGVGLLTGCGGGSADTKADLAKDFGNNNASTAFEGSMIVIPDNLKLSVTSTSGKKSKANDDESLAVNLYGTIHQSVKFSDEIIEGINDLFDQILESQVLVTSEPGVVIPVDDGGNVTAYMIEDISGVNGEKFKWKLSLYFNNSESPDMIIRFTLKNNSMKGQMIANIKNSSAYQVNGVETVIDINSVVKVTFDGTETMKKLDVDITSDLESMLAFVEANKANLSEEQIETLDIDRAGKFSLRVQYDGTEYGISGCGYAPGALLEGELTGKDKIFGDERSTYTFRAKSITGEVDGAKMDIAIPVNTLDNVNTIWETDSFSQIFQNKFVEFVNVYIASLIDENDDSEEDNEGFEGSVNAEQQLGFNSLYWFLGENLAIPTLSEHGLVITSEEYENAVNFWGEESFQTDGITTLENINLILSITDGSITDETKKFIYYRIMAPEVIAYYQVNPISFTISDIEAILEKTNDDDSNAFRTLLETIKHLVNPAFFEKEIGFLGTFDGTDFYAYDKESNSLDLGTKPENFDSLNALDLTLLEAIIPNDVYTMVIEVK